MYDSSKERKSICEGSNWFFDCELLNSIFTVERMDSSWESLSIVDKIEPSMESKVILILISVCLSRKYFEINSQEPKDSWNRKWTEVDSRVKFRIENWGLDFVVLVVRLLWKLAGSWKWFRLMTCALSCTRTTWGRRELIFIYGPSSFNILTFYTQFRIMGIFLWSGKIFRYWSLKFMQKCTV